MSKPGDPRNTYRWKQLRKQLLTHHEQQNTPCWICQTPINYQLNGRHRAGPTLDHIQPIAHDGDPYDPTNLAPAHRSCNNTKYNKPKNPNKKTTNPQKPKPAQNHEPKKTGLLSDQTPTTSPPSVHFLPQGVKPVTDGDGFVGRGVGNARFVSESHPEAVGSLGGEWAGWLQRSVGIELRPWQRLVFERGLEVKADGSFAWGTVLVSASRQSGKSWLLNGLMAARCELLDGPQETYLVSNNTLASKRTQSRLWTWAEEQGLVVRRAGGQEVIRWPDGSHYTISAYNSIYGASGHLVAVDECWDLDEEVVESAIMPIQLERENSQLWMLSSANPEATNLMPKYRRMAMEGSTRVCLIEWGAFPHERTDSEVVWRASMPHFSEDRLEAMREQHRNKSFPANHLNIWPQDLGNNVAEGWPLGWEDCPQLAGLEPFEPVVVVESSHDRRWWNLVVAWRHEGGVAVRFARFTSRDECVAAAVQVSGVVVVLMGATLTREIPADRWRVPVKPVGGVELPAATAELQRLVSDRRLWHDHDEGLAVQVRAARVRASERGPVLSAVKSFEGVDGLKAVAWACEWLGREQPPRPKPAVW